MAQESSAEGGKRKDPFVAKANAAADQGTAGGAEPEKSQPKEKLENVSVLATVDWIEADYAKIRKLLHANMGKADATEILTQMERWVNTGEATVLESLSLVARSGQRAKADSSEGYIYATEADSPYYPDEISLRDSPFDGRFLGTPSNPTAFQTRNVGSIVEMDPILSAGYTEAYLNISAEIVRLLRTQPAMDVKVDEAYAKIMGGYAMPIFYRMQVTTSVHPEMGKPALVSVQTPYGASDRRVLVFVTVEVPGLK